MHNKPVFGIEVTITDSFTNFIIIANNVPVGGIFYGES